MARNRAIVAAAGSRKTQHIVEHALAREVTTPALVLAFTIENQNQIAERVRTCRGDSQAQIRIMGWMKFLLSEGARPYQRALTKEPFFIKGMDFDGQHRRGTNSSSVRYFVGRNGQAYGRNLSHLVVTLNERTRGAVVRRLEGIYDHIYIDEVQDLVGWDLELLDLLLASQISVTLVADPRQHTYATNRNNKNTQYRGAGLMRWFEERANNCDIETRTENYRCPQSVCEFADSLYPDLPASVSVCPDPGDHTGIHFIHPDDAHEYYSAHRPQVLRGNRASNVADLPAMNMGQAKGSAFDHVMIFPTKPINEYLGSRDPSLLKNRSRSKLYVAITRARRSVAFVTKLTG